MILEDASHLQKIVAARHSTRSREANKTKQTQFLGRAGIGHQGRAGPLRNALGFEPVGDCGAVDRRLLRWFEPVSANAAKVPRLPALLDGFAGNPSSLTTNVRS